MVEIWRVFWYASEGSDPMRYYFRDDANIESTFSTWYPGPPVSYYAKETIQVDDNSTEYKMCLDNQEA